MAWSYVGGNTGRSSSSTASVTHGLTINSGDLVVAYVNIDGTSSITADDAGWTEAVNAQPSGETARHALYWKSAGASEPSSYSWSLGSSALWQAHVRVYRGSGAPEADLAAATDKQGSGDHSVICGAQDGRTVAAGAVSLIFGGKDNRNASNEEYTKATSGGAGGEENTGFVSVMGDTGSQATASAHRIYTSSSSYSGNVFLETADLNDGTSDTSYSAHISFVEAASAATVTATVTDASGNALANETDIDWNWSDTFNGNPTDSGTGESTDGSGELVVDLPNTGLSSGQFGYLQIKLSNDDVGIAKESID